MDQITASYQWCVEDSVIEHESFEELFDRYDVEMRKLVIMQRMTIEIHKRLERGNCRELRDILSSYKV